MLKKKQALVMSVLCAIASVGFVLSTSAKEPENYNLGEIVVEGRMDDANPHNTYDGKIIRTGGDVTIITSREIEKQHYDNVTDAISKVPGVEVKTPGYRGIEFGNAYTGATVAINGDNRVIFCVDGKRMGSDAITTNMNERSKGEVALLMGIANIERIEVIRGAASLAYGSDATGGVINIITKKAEHSSTNIDLAAGSWGKRKGSIAHMGRKDKFGYLASWSRDQGDDTKYKDHYLNTTKTFKNTDYKEDTAFIKLDYDFDNNRALTFSYSRIDNYAGYPIFAPDYEWEGAVKDYLATGNRQPGVTNPNNRWHRWWYYYGDSVMGSYSKVKANDIDLKYTFSKIDQVDNYIRFYNNKNEHYMHRYRIKDDLSGLDRLEIASHEEDVKGTELRVGRKINSKDYLYAGMTYQHSKYDRLETETSSSTQHINRDSFSAFIQDKIKLGNKWTVTPGLRYSYVGDSKKDGKVNAESDGKVTMGAFAEYKFDDTGDVYFSWSQVYNTPYAADIENQQRYTPDKPLQSEKGDAYTIGLNKQFDKKNRVSINYSLVDMKNAIGRYSIWVDSENDYKRTSTNIKMKKRAFNVSGEHKFDDSWSLRGSFSYAITDKDLTNLSSSYTSYDNLYNNYKYTNKYLASLNYNKGKWNGGLDVEHYTGLDERYFSDNKFTVLNMHVNYKITKEMTAYFVMNNITNEAYETRANATYGIGTFPMEGRNFLIGVNYKF